jgi:hypothetical protein
MLPISSPVANRCAMVASVVAAAIRFIPGLKQGIDPTVAQSFLLKLSCGLRGRPPLRISRFASITSGLRR